MFGYTRPRYSYRGSYRPRALLSGRLILAVIIAVISIISYLSTSSENPVTGEKQRVALSPSEEIALGLQSRPEMARQFGGLDSDQAAQNRLDQIGHQLVSQGIGKKTPYQFDFHLLADPKTVNAFALPGGQIFITRALFDKLNSPGQVAGVLGHEIGHVLERHSSQQIAKAELTAGLTNAAVIATYDPNSRTSNAAAIAAIVGQIITMKYGRKDELESDQWGVKLTANAGYDPRALLKVMAVLEQSNQGATPPEFLSTHPNSNSRISAINKLIQESFPNGVPSGLIE